MVSKQIRHKRTRPTIFLIGSILIMLAGIGTTFLWQTHSELPARAASGDVVGPPTLPAATVDSILANMGSPMAGTGAVIEQASRQTNIDDAFALAVWWTETNDGAAGVGSADRNPGSVRGSYGYPAAFDGYTIYSSYSAGIIDWFNLVRNRYVDRGLSSAYTICYPYVGTSSSYQWAIKVVNLMVKYHDEAPPPPTPTPTSIPTPNAVLIQHIQVHVVKPKPAAQGKIREVHVAGNIIAPIVVGPSIAAPAPAHSPSGHSSPLAAIIILLGLLAALLIALWGAKIGHFTVPAPVPSPVIPVQSVQAFALSAFTPLPDLYANEFSPFHMPQTEQLPLTPIPQPQPIQAFSDSVDGGLLKRYANTDALPRKVRLRSATMVDEQELSLSTSSDLYKRIPVTPAHFTVPVRPIQEKVLEPLDASAGASGRPMGLLRRYSIERDNHNE